MELRQLLTNYLGVRLTAATFTTTGSTATAGIGTKEFSDVSRTSAGRMSATTKRAGIAVTGYAQAMVGQVSANIADGGYASYSSAAAGTMGMRMFDASGTGDEGTGHMFCLTRDIDETDRLTNSAAVQVSCGNGEGPVLYACRITSAGVASQPGIFKSITKASSVYTLVLKDSFHRAPVVLVTPISTAQKAARLTAEPTASTIVVSTFSSAEAAEDNAFDIFILGFMSKEEEGTKNAPIMIPRLGARLIPFAFFDDGAGNMTLYQGGDDFTGVINGTGDYTLTFKTTGDKRGGRAEPLVAVMGAARAQLKDTPTTTSINIVTFNAAGAAATSTNNLGFAIVFDSADGLF